MKEYKHKYKFDIDLNNNKVCSTALINSSLNKFKLNLQEFYIKLNKLILNYKFTKCRLIIFINNNKDYCIKIKIPSLKNLIKIQNYKNISFNSKEIESLALLKLNELYPISLKSIIKSIQGTLKTYKQNKNENTY